MYLAAFLFIWILRAWKIREMDRAHLDKEHREQAIRDDDGVANQGNDALRRQDSRAVSMVSVAKEGLSIAKYLFAWQKV